MDLQNLLPALDVRQSHVDLPVKAAGPQEGGVQHIRAVGGGQDHHPLVGGKAVHLHQQLVEGLLPLVVPAAKTGAPLTAHGVDLINEYDGGRVLFRLLKEVPDPAGAHAHIQLHKVRAGDGEEAHAGLPRHGLGKERLAGARRAHQQHALGNPRPQGDELLGVLEELHNLLELLLLLVGAGHIVKGDFLILVREHPGPGGAEFGHPVRPHAAALGADHHEVEEGPQHQRRENPGQEQLQPVGGLRRGIVVGGDDPPGLLVPDQVVEVAVKERKIVDVVLDLSLRLIPQRQREGIAVGKGEGRDLLLLKELDHFGIDQFLRLPVQSPDPVHAQENDQCQQQEGKVGCTMLS